MKQLALFTAALIGVAGIAHAQPTGTSTTAPYQPAPYEQAQSGSSMGCGHQVAITDEYGFKYDSMGNRLNGRGCVIPPPHTPPGGRAIQG